MATLFQIMTLDGYYFDTRRSILCWCAELCLCLCRWMSEIVHPVGDVYPFAWLVFLLWCCIGALGLLNLMTAIFIDSLTVLSRKGESIKRGSCGGRLLSGVIFRI